jgi:hypothetical protein
MRFLLYLKKHPELYGFLPFPVFILVNVVMIIDLLAIPVLFYLN